MKKKTIKSGNWACDIVYIKQENKEIISALKSRIDSEIKWRAILHEKKRLEEELSAVRIEILKRCIKASCEIIFQCKKKLKKLETPARKTKKKKK